MLRRWSILAGLMAFSLAYESLENQVQGQGFGYPSCQGCFGYPQPQSNVAPNYYQQTIPDSHWVQPTIETWQAPIRIEPGFVQPIVPQNYGHAEQPAYPSVIDPQPIFSNTELPFQSLAQPSLGRYNGIELSNAIQMPTLAVPNQIPAQGYLTEPTNKQPIEQPIALANPVESNPSQPGVWESSPSSDSSAPLGNSIEGRIDPEQTASPSDIREGGNKSVASDANPEKEEDELLKLRKELESIRADLGKHLERARTAEERTYGLEKAASAQEKAAKEREASLMKEIEKLNEQIANSKEQLSSTENMARERDGLIAELKTLQKSLKEAEQVKQESQKAMEQQVSLKKQLETMQRQLAEAQASAKEKESEFKKLKLSSDQAAEQFSTREEAFRITLEALRSESKQGKMTLKDKESFEKVERELKSQLDALSTRAKEAESAAKKLVAQKEEALAKSKKELNSKIQRLEEQLAKMKAEARRTEAEKKKEEQGQPSKDQKNEKADSAPKTPESVREKRKQEREQRAKESDRKADKKPESEMKSRKEAPVEPATAPQRPRRPDEADRPSNDNKDAAPEPSTRSQTEMKESETKGDRKRGARTLEKASDQSEKTQLLEEKIRILEETMQTKLEQSRIRISNRIDEQKRKLIEKGEKEDGDEIKVLEKKKQSELNNSSNKIRADFSGKLDEVRKELKEFLKEKSDGK